MKIYDVELLVLGNNDIPETKREHIMARNWMDALTIMSVELDSTSNVVSCLY